jgi:colanic acid biosynthesis glycosyl transferase WcaI
LRILVYGLNHAPEPTGVGRYTGDMVAWLAERGHEVRVVTAYPYYPAWRVAPGYRAGRYGREVVDGVPVRRCPIWVPKTPTTAKRMLHLALFAATSLPVVAWTAWRWRPDLVWTTEPTSFGLPGALLAARLGRARSWLHVQDIELGAAVRLGMIRNLWLQKRILATYRFLLRRFAVVSTISPSMACELAGFGAPETVFFPNWVDVEAIRPGVATDRLRAELGLPPTGLIALYSGNMGEKQGVETLVAAAKALRDRPDVHFLLCGEGAARARLEAEAAGLANVSLRPLQPLERFNELLNLADIHLLPQRRGTTLFAMPSKLGGMLASGRAIVAQADPGSAFADFVADCALVVPTEDAAATAEAIRRLADDAALRARLGEAGRRRAVARLSRDAILERFVADAEACLAHEGATTYDDARSGGDRSAQNG